MATYTVLVKYKAIENNEPLIIAEKFKVKAGSFFSAQKRAASKMKLIAADEFLIQDIRRLD